MALKLSDIAYKTKKCPCCLVTFTTFVYNDDTRAAGKVLVSGDSSLAIPTITEVCLSCGYIMYFMGEAK